MRRERHSFFLCLLFHLTPLASSKPKSQLTVFFKFQNPPPITFGHDVIHVPGHISYLVFLLWHLWLSHPPRVCVNTCTQCVHLTNPCTKRKVLRLTKPKGKIYKTKNSNIKIIPPQLYNNYTERKLVPLLVEENGKIPWNFTVPTDWFVNHFF